MSFIDNPVISSLGNALGMGGLFDEMSGAAASAPDPSPTPKPGVTKPNIPEYKNRPYIPRNEEGTRGVTPGAPGGGNPTMPGPMSQDTLNDPGVSKLLGQYGVTPSQAPPDPNLFIHNPAAFQHHPVLAGMVERGLGGLAYAHEGNNFLQSLIGGVKGMQEYNAASAQQVNSQLMAPFQQADAVADLQHKSDLHNAALDEIKYHEGQLANAKAGQATKAARLAAIPPRPNKSTGEMMTLQGDPDDPDTLQWKPAPELGQDEELANKNAYFQHATAAAQAANRAAGKAEDLTDDQRSTIASHWAEQQSVAKSAGARSVRRIPTTHIGSGSSSGDKPGKLTDVQKSQISALNKEEATINQSISHASDLSKPVYDDNNRPLMSPSARVPYVASKRARLSAIQSQRNQILNTGSPPDQQAPAPPTNQNPFTTPPSNSNPFRH